MGLSNPIHLKIQNVLSCGVGEVYLTSYINKQIVFFYFINKLKHYLKMPIKK